MKWALLLLTISQLGFSQNLKFTSTWLEKKSELDNFASMPASDFLKKYPNSNNQTVYWQWPSEIQPDPFMGRRNRPLVQARQIGRRADRLVYDAIYSFDEFGRRYSPVSDQRDSFILLSGCSFTYGNGLNDDQTLSHYMNQSQNKYQVYNYGMGATGTNSTLALVQTTDFKKQIKQANGVMVYVFIESHIDRSTGKLPSLSWLGLTPAYKKISDGVMIRNGNLLEENYGFGALLLKAYPMLKKMNLGNRIFPPVFPWDVTKVCELVEATKNEFHKQYPNSKFMIYGHPFDGIFRPQFKSCLEKKKIWAVQGKPIPPLIFDGDGHPKAEANRLIQADILESIAQH
jgi:hypothetical protein